MSVKHVHRLNEPGSLGGFTDKDGESVNIRNIVWRAL